jgi:large subunit ribosomal protein L29
MKDIKKVRDMSLDDLKRQLVTSKETYFNLRFQHKTGQLEDSSMLKKTRRDIARFETIIRETQPNEQ